MNEHMRATETIVENTPAAREQAVWVTRSMQHATLRTCTNMPTRQGA